MGEENLGLIGIRSPAVQPVSSCYKYFFLVFFCTLRFVLICFFVLLSCIFLLSLLRSLNTNIHVPGGIRSRNPSKISAADPRLILLDHWDRHWAIPATPERGKINRTAKKRRNKEKVKIKLTNRTCGNVLTKWLKNLMFQSPSYIAIFVLPTHHMSLFTLQPSLYETKQ